MFLRKYKEKQFLVDTAQCVFVSRAVREYQFDELGGLRRIAVFVSDIFRRYKLRISASLLTVSRVILHSQARTSTTLHYLTVQH
jgi:hypothetical protein